jgi:hypothetical protein
MKKKFFLSFFFLSRGKNAVYHKHLACAQKNGKRRACRSLAEIFLKNINIIQSRDADADSPLIKFAVLK